MNRRANRAWLPKAYLALLIAAATPSILLAQEPLWGGALVSKIDSLAAMTLSQGPVAALSIGVKRGDQLLLASAVGSMTATMRSWSIRLFRSETQPGHGSVPRVMGLRSNACSRY